MTSTPKRRWFRFTLRTLFVVVTVFGIWLGWQFNVVCERETIVKEISRRNAFFGTLDLTQPPKPLPFPWALLGARPIDRIELHAGFTDNEQARIKSYFPETDVDRSTPDSGFFSWEYSNTFFSTLPYLSPQTTCPSERQPSGYQAGSTKSP